MAVATALRATFLWAFIGSLTATTCTTITGYTAYPDVDNSDTGLGGFGTDTVVLMNACDLLPGCVGFNQNGDLKFSQGALVSSPGMCYYAQDSAGPPGQNPAMGASPSPAPTYQPGPPGSDVSFPPQIVVTEATNFTTPDGGVIRFTSGSVTTFNAPVTFSGTGTLVAEPGATFVFSAPVVMAVPATFNGASFSLAGGITLTFSGGDVVLQNSVGSGSGSFIFQWTDTSSAAMARKAGDAAAASQGPLVSLIASRMAPPLVQVGKGKRPGSRRTSLQDYSISLFCGSINGPVTLDGLSAMQLQLSCQVAGQLYSNVIDSVSATEAGALIGLTNVSRSGLPTLLQTINNPNNVQLEISSSEVDAFSTVLFLYGNPGSCVATWPATTDNCPSGFSCSVMGHTVNSSYCAVVFTQQSTSASSGNSSDEALFGLLGLLAIIPIGAFFGGLAWLGRRDYSPSLSTIETAYDVPKEENLSYLPGPTRQPTPWGIA